MGGVSLQISAGVLFLFISMQWTPNFYRCFCWVNGLSNRSKSLRVVNGMHLTYNLLQYLKKLFEAEKSKPVDDTDSFQEKSRIALFSRVS